MTDDTKIIEEVCGVLHGYHTPGRCKDARKVVLVFRSAGWCAPGEVPSQYSVEDFFDDAGVDPFAEGQSTQEEQ